MKREFVFFCIAGSIGFVIDVIVVSCLREALGVYGARIPSFLCAATGTWVFNRRYTFQGTVKRNIWSEYVHYLSLMGVGGILNYVVYAAAISFLCDWQYGLLISVALGTGAGLVVNFLISKYYIFKPKG